MCKYLSIGIRFGIYLVMRYPKILWYRLFRKRIPYEVLYDYIRKLTLKLNQRLRIHYEVIGTEYIPQHNNLVFLPNHQSLFDTVLLYSQIPQRCSFIAKKEVAKMPIIGSIAKMVEVLLLDREDARSALNTLKEAANHLKIDRNLLVFLEGTRTKDEHHEVGIFKNGGIRPAYSAQSTLVPIAIDHSWKVFNRHIHKKDYYVQLAYLPPIAYEDYKDLSYQQLADHVRQLMVDKIIEMRKSEKTPEDR